MCNKADNNLNIAITDSTKWAKLITQATTSTSGVVKLNNTTNSTSTTEAATANAVKVTMDKASSAENAASAAKTAADSAKKTAEAVASTTTAGRVKLSSAVNSTAENQAATPKAVKTAYDLANAALPKAGGTVNNEVISTSLNALRFKNSDEDISSLIRFDGVRLWFLFTNKGDAYGNFNSMRPMSINAATGLINIGTTLTIQNIPALKQGDGGVLSTGQMLTNLDDTNFLSGFFITASSTSGTFPTSETVKEGSCIFVKRTPEKGSQLFLSAVTNRIYLRSFHNSKFSTWQELITTANLHEHEKKDIVLKSIQTFTSSGTYTPTIGVTTIRVHVIGGGGGGARRQGITNDTYPCSGGGGGGYSMGVFSGDDVVSTSYIVGGGGRSDIEGASGGTSTFKTLIANGGGGGNYNKTSAGGSGGGASGGIVNINGSGGESNAYQGGFSFYSPIYGAGGAGSLTKGAIGRNGFQGCIIIEEYE